MHKFRVKQTVTTIYYYDVETDDIDNVISIIEDGNIEVVDSEVIDTDYDIEEMIDE